MSLGFLNRQLFILCMSSRYLPSFIKLTWKSKKATTIPSWLFTPHSVEKSSGQPWLHFGMYMCTGNNYMCTGIYSVEKSVSINRQILNGDQNEKNGLYLVSILIFLSLFSKTEPMMIKILRYDLFEQKER